MPFIEISFWLKINRVKQVVKQLYIKEQKEKKEKKSGKKNKEKNKNL